MIEQSKAEPADERRSRNVLLLVPPFQVARAPSHVAGLLKAALAHDAVACDVLYVTLPFAEIVGPELYSAIATSGTHQATLVGEWLFAGDLFGEGAPDPTAYIGQVLRGSAANAYDQALIDRLLAVRARVPGFLDDVMDRVDWGHYAIVAAMGMGPSFQHQNCATLALLQRVKRRRPAAVTVMGGANCDGPLGAAIHDLFPFVDYVCAGESDRAFPLLVRALLTGETCPSVPGILARRGPRPAAGTPRAPMVRTLDQLPYPDHDDYFAQLAALGLGDRLDPRLTFETSRGCWWGEKHHCTFCGLNGAGMAYRSKSPGRALDELDVLVARYGVRDVHMLDEILDLRYFDSFLPALTERDDPLRLFYETKANLSKDQLRLLARAGVREIQPGIESLSTPVLRLMDKGVTALQNVRLLKWCAEIGIAPVWNILCGFPGEDPAEYAAMAELVPSLIHLEPPGRIGRIRLDRFSPNFDQAAERGFANVRAAAPYRHVYPFDVPDLDRLAYTFDFDYADGRDPSSYTEGLREVVVSWQQRRGVPRLTLHDDGQRLAIRDTRPTAPCATTVLDGAARLAYLALDAGATVTTVMAELRRGLGVKAPCTEVVERWLAEWLAARLVLCEGPRYLSLTTNPAERVRCKI